MHKISQRNQDIIAAFREGKTLQQIGTQYGVTRQRVQQILRRYGIKRMDGGKSLQKRLARAARLEKKNRMCLEKHGMTWPAYRRLQMIGKGMMKAGARREITPIGAFTQQRQNAATRGIDWKLKLGEWWEIWTLSGKWAMRGKLEGHYVMARKGDEGPYAVGNVEIKTSSDNHREYLAKRWRNP